MAILTEYFRLPSVNGGGTPFTDRFSKKVLGTFPYIAIFLKHYIKSFSMTIVDGTKCKTCFWCPRMVLIDSIVFLQMGVWPGATIPTLRFDSDI